MRLAREQYTNMSNVKCKLKFLRYNVAITDKYGKIEGIPLCRKEGKPFLTSLQAYSVFRIEHYLNIERKFYG
jgi:hypothetical protein